MRASGVTTIGRAVAAATSTRLGVGGAVFHYAETEGEVDTVYMGLCRRNVYESIGSFDERMVRNQDDELSYRLRGRGGKIVCNPQIRSTYYNRSTLNQVAKQYFQYGLWKIRVLQMHPRQMRVSHFVPPIFVLAAGVAVGESLLAPRARMGLIVGLPYGSAVVVYSLIIVKSHGLLTGIVTALVYPTLHVSYGLGFLTGLARFRRRWHPLEGGF